jgi:hypothetical protein
MMRCLQRAAVLALALVAQHAARTTAQSPASAPAPADTVQRRADANATRLFFAPTGRTLDKHRGYIADYEVFFPMIAYGLTDRISVAAGMSIIPTLGITDQVVYFSPKVGIVRSQKFNAAVGLLIIHPANLNCGNEDGCNVGIAYGAGTWGSPDASVTAGLGFGFVNGEFSSDPFIVLGADKRVSRKIALVTENWIVPAIDNQALISAGVRFLGESLTVDFALATPIGNDSDVTLIPYIDFAFHF